MGSVRLGVDPTPRMGRLGTPQRVLIVGGGVSSGCLVLVLMTSLPRAVLGWALIQASPNGCSFVRLKPASDRHGPLGAARRGLVAAAVRCVLEVEKGLLECFVAELAKMQRGAYGHHS